MPHVPSKGCSNRESKDDSEDEGSQVFIGSVTSQIHETSSGIASRLVHKTEDLLPWYIDSGAEILVMPKALYKKSYGDMSICDSRKSATYVRMRSYGTE